MLDVRCVSKIKHAIASVSPTLNPEPKVTIIMDDRTFEVFANRILVNDQLFSAISQNIEEVRIDINEVGFKISVDGDPVESAAELD